MHLSTLLSFHCTLKLQELQVKEKVASSAQGCNYNKEG